MRETQQSISAWAEEAFGPTTSSVGCAVRANEELAELLKALVTRPKSEQAVAEAADVMIVLYRLAERLGFELHVSSLPNDGPKWTALGYASAANMEMARLISMLEASDRHPLALQRCLGVGHYMLRIALLLGADLYAEIDRKMEINRGREWIRDGFGHGRHA